MLWLGTRGLAHMHGETIAPGMLTATRRWIACCLTLCSVAYPTCGGNDR